MFQNTEWNTDNLDLRVAARHSRRLRDARTQTVTPNHGSFGMIDIFLGSGGYRKSGPKGKYDAGYWHNHI